jgi:hypothetical protein
LSPVRLALRLVQARVRISARATDAGRAAI